MTSIYYMTLLQHAIRFREAYNQEMQDGFVANGFIKEQLFDLQLDLIAEESNEFFEACHELYKDQHSTAKQTDALKELADLVFVCFQFAAAFGLDLDTAMRRVFESNMSKLGADGKPIYREDGKVLKGPNYKRANVSDLIPNNDPHYNPSGK